MLSKAGKGLLKTCHPPAATLNDLFEDILMYKCANESCASAVGGCLRAQFQGNENEHQIKMLLSLYREKVRSKNEEELKKFAIDLFKDHCININAVFSSTEADKKDLFSREGDAMMLCGVCLPPLMSSNHSHSKKRTAAIRREQVVLVI